MIKIVFYKSEFFFELLKKQQLVQEQKLYL